MREDTLQTLQTSFLRLASDRTATSQIFYARLFELDPSLRPLFRNDLAAQQQKLMTAMVQMMRSIDQPDELARSITGMAQRHLGYGMRPEHIDTFGRALLWTLEKQLGPKFTPEVRDAWQSTYADVSQRLVNAMAGMLEPGRATGS